MSQPARPRPRPERRYRRLTLRVDVRLETGGECRRAIATTLGAGGLFVATDAPLPTRTLLCVCFALPGDDEENCLDARVAWSERPGVGVRTPGMGLEFTHAGARSALAARLEAWAD